MDYYKESLKFHEENHGKLEIKSKKTIETKDDLSIAYTPGVAEVCKKIAEIPKNVYKYTNKSNMVAVISDGSAVLGLGNIGAEAGIPVMEGKAVLFKEFANIDAFPICIKTQEPEEIINIVRNISPVFGGINLEDISAPRCFEIEEKLQDLGIPVFHDDQHGTAIVVLAGLINSLKITNKKIEDIKVVINGIGAAGTAIFKLLIKYGINPNNVLLLDSKGIIYNGRDNLNNRKEGLSQITNTACKKSLEDPKCIIGGLKDALKGRDVFIGVSKAKLLDEDMIKTMAKDPIIFAMANPEPEIMPDLAKKAGVTIIATGRSDFPNQVNNVLVFPGIFRGVLDAKIAIINDEIKLLVAKTIAEYTKNINHENILPSPLDKGIAKAISQAIMEYKNNL